MRYWTLPIGNWKRKTFVSLDCRRVNDRKDKQILTFLEMNCYFDDVLLWKVLDWKQTGKNVGG